MLIRQITVFLENRQGKFAEIAKLLGDNNINMKCFTVSETDDFGLARILVDDGTVDPAYRLLKDNSYAASINNLVYIECSNTPGAMAKAMKLLSEAGIFIEYMYAYAEDGASVSHVVIRTDNEELANSILSAQNF